MAITKPLVRLASVVHQDRDVDDWEMMEWVLAGTNEEEEEMKLGEVEHRETMEDITWRFFPPMVTVPSIEEAWFEPEERKSKPLVVSIRLFPKKGSVNPVRIAVWALSAFMVAATVLLLLQT